MDDLAARYAPPARPAFGAWLLQQKNRSGLLGQLAIGATLDKGFPREGDVEAVRRRLTLLHADSDMFAAVDDAELDWLSA